MKCALDVTPERDEGCGPIIGLYSRGHHDPTAFLREAVRAGRRNGWFDDAEWGLGVRHLWWRKIPGDGGFMWIHDAAGPGRGAFPVTHIPVYPVT